MVIVVGQLFVYLCYLAVSSGSFSSSLELASSTKLILLMSLLFCLLRHNRAKWPIFCRLMHFTVSAGHVCWGLQLFYPQSQQLFCFVLCCRICWFCVLVVFSGSSLISLSFASAGGMVECLCQRSKLFCVSFLSVILGPEEVSTAVVCVSLSQTMFSEKLYQFIGFDCLGICIEFAFCDNLNCRRSGAPDKILSDFRFFCIP